MTRPGLTAGDVAAPGLGRGHRQPGPSAATARQSSAASAGQAPCDAGLCRGFTGAWRPRKGGMVRPGTRACAPSPPPGRWHAAAGARPLTWSAFRLRFQRVVPGDDDETTAPGWVDPVSGSFLPPEAPEPTSSWWIRVPYWWRRGRALLYPELPWGAPPEWNKRSGRGKRFLIAWEIWTFICCMSVLRRVYCTRAAIPTHATHTRHTHTTWRVPNTAGGSVLTKLDQQTDTLQAWFPGR